MLKFIEWGINWGTKFWSLKIFNKSLDNSNKNEINFTKFKNRNFN